MARASTSSRVLDYALRDERKTDWRHDLRHGRGENKDPDGSLLNAKIALSKAPEWDGVICYNEMQRQVVQVCHGPWESADRWGKKLPQPLPWSDLQTIRTTIWLQENAINLQTRVVREAVIHEASLNCFHPVKDYLHECCEKWDGEPRIDSWLNTYAKADRSEFVTAIGARWLISGVARIYEPGCKADHMLVLEGQQGIGKSSIAAILGGEYFTDDLPNLESKDAAMAVASHWIVEMSELTALRKSMVETVKAFLSRTVDKYRPPYGRDQEFHPRQCIFIGTVNDAKYLMDTTGNRRFWPVASGLRVEEWAATREALLRDRDQLWGEAVQRYRDGCKWHLDTPTLIAAAQVQQSARLEEDVWQDEIETAVAEMERELGYEGLTVGMVLKKLGKPKENWNHADSKRVQSVLRFLKFEPCEKRVREEDGKTRARLWKRQETR